MPFVAAGRGYDVTSGHSIKTLWDTCDNGRQHASPTSKLDLGDRSRCRLDHLDQSLQAASERAILARIHKARRRYHANSPAQPVGPASVPTGN